MTHSVFRKVLIGLAVLIAAAGAFYYAYWLRTPQYAAGEIYQAVTHKDYQLFRERVDLPKVYSAAVDDLADAAAASDERDHRIAAGFMKTFKKPLVDALIRETERSFHPAEEKEEPSLLSPLTDAAKTYAGSAALSMTEILDVTDHGDTSVARVRLHDKALDKDFTWEVLLEKDANDSWTATRVLNFKEYLAERKALEDTKKSA